MYLLNCYNCSEEFYNAQLAEDIVEPMVHTEDIADEAEALERFEALKKEFDFVELEEE